MHDATVIGSGPNGLAAAVTLARAGLSVTVLERNTTIGGGARTEELTLPGFRHDVCSAVHPMAVQSEFFRRFRLQDRIELRWPDVQYAHPLSGDRAGIAYQDLGRTADGLGADGAAYSRLLAPLVERVDELSHFANDSLVNIPQHPVTLVRFARRVLEQGSPAWNARFRHDIAPAMLTGVAAHSIRRMPSLATAASALTLGVYAHARGWPVPVGGSRTIIDALASDLIAHGGEIVTDHDVRSLRDLEPSRVTLFDTSVPAMLRIAGSTVPAAIRRSLRRFRFGNGVAKVDFALSEPIPWSNPDVRRAGTVHIGGTRTEIAAAEHAVAHGRHHPRPFVLGSQPTVVDPTRAPEGQHVFWSYAHVPAGSTVDQADIVSSQIERFAPGFRDTILAVSSRTATQMEEYNPNYVGGDIASGAATFWQLVKRPRLSPEPWVLGNGLYLCSEAASPGPGVHGMAGWHAARSALRNTFHLPDDFRLADSKG
ncbi:NAD(P)/FAD-dependent oxidoreductase [Curtobacterium sp. MCSS17_016]|uniref:phytoene desaturase family protein n=1 Tax=Curtobacterium sp. MCSS17_016 TaxID=2175644 RepID=UPI000DAAC3DE|nr:NAD(P)/FAD-dependent oxidoreductase [Curtobacterium sp. MCSS17_016]WIE80547.1 NAD(P)/FAD-dependent oxidoreductase [Curtobacterium sp. MCSS17_016]